MKRELAPRGHKPLKHDKRGKLGSVLRRLREKAEAGRLKRQQGEQAAQFFAGPDAITGHSVWGI